MLLCRLLRRRLEIHLKPPRPSRRTTSPGLQLSHNTVTRPRPCLFEQDDRNSTRRGVGEESVGGTDPERQNYG